ncbi:MAG: T9SS type A sorting domain-containing protein [Candidatus Poribacteria bacterium]|nr:T9SS type A sorting domain-containing protein [Candidatus Poribacteria bacterium]
MPESSHVKPFPNSLPVIFGGLKRGVLLQNYPNPFNTETWIPFRLIQPSRVTIRIYDLRGSLVHIIPIGALAVGNYSAKSEAVYWNGRNQNNERVSSGVYSYVLEASGERHVRRLTVVE